MVTETNYVGDLVRLKVDFKNVSGTPADPANVSVTVLQPDGVAVIKSLSDGVVNDSAATGAFYYDFTVAQTGRHYVTWVGSGTVTAVISTEFHVLSQRTGS